MAIGNDDGTWDLSGMDTTVPNSSERPTHTKRIYRTVSGQTGTTYFFVAEITLAASTYSDTTNTDEVSLNEQLISASWNEPPTDMIGMVAHPNGFLVGFSGRNLYFSEPYRPHAWPAEYTLSTLGDIQALALFASSIGIPTSSFPYICMGSNPAAMSLIRQDSPEPCASRLGVVGTSQGVLYPSFNGLVLLGPAGVQLVSKGFMSRDEWRDTYRPESIEAAVYRNYYVATFGDGFGFIVDFDNMNGVFSELNQFMASADSMQTDPYDGQIVFVRDNEVYSWDNATAAPLDYRWKSKEMVTPKPVNMGYFRIDSESFEAGSSATADAQALAFNIDRSAKGPLNPLNHSVVGGTRIYDGTYTIDPAIVPALAQNQKPLGGSVIIKIPLPTSRSVRVTLFADRVEVFSGLVSRSGRYRLPTGYKADIFEVEFEGNAEISHFKMAETGKDLARV